MRDEHGFYVRAAAPIGGSYKYGDLICLGTTQAVILIRGDGYAFFLTCDRKDLVL